MAKLHIRSRFVKQLQSQEQGSESSLSIMFRMTTEPRSSAAGLRVQKKDTCQGL